ncbi:MAG: putative drug exporter of the superfamily, partial [Acidimicrobiaceae bacterium]
MHGTHEPRSSSRTGAPATGLLGRLGRWCFDHRLAAVALWLVALVSIFGAVGAVGPSYKETFDVPNSGSARGFAVLKEHFPQLGAGGQSGTIVFRAQQGVDDPRVAVAMQELFALVDSGFPDDAGVAQHPGATVVSPYSAEGAGQIAREGPLAGQLAFAQVNLGVDVDRTEASLLGAAITEHAPVLDGLEVLPGGVALAKTTVPETEFIGLAFAVVVLILAFGSVLAMGLPLAVAVAGVGAGVGLTAL